MKMKSFIVFFLCIVTMTTGLAGCSSGIELPQKEFSGISFKIPAEWGEPVYESNDNITYSLNLPKPPTSIFYIYTFPKETYKSKFYNEESNTYKGLFELSSEEKLKNKLNLMVFHVSTKDYVVRDESEPKSVILLAFVETDEHVLEVTMEIPEDYFENNKELIHSIYNSIKIN
ncbi:hypothetical protein PAE9249_04922 [Paenibacillus sp. CECT 9249]|uniref:hypothetical protein n=1 Tax=Paenibacillus sp. CECT 9249 TaxID=2845385 RepID=UPI001E3E364D|nr:hypothetical protein [Paenibacillus sp. CECT 9249]CAH0122372.1 hypothetical protein PAE9249_04922 [Paenibacillus sp. CECT 9249]